MSTKFYKTELHCHLDGSLPVETIRELISLQKERFSRGELEAYLRKDDFLKNQLVAPSNCKSLEEYLRCFDLPLKVLQTPDAMRIAGKAIANQLKAQGVRYAEIRFAPQLHTMNVGQGSLWKHQEEIIRALLEGIASVTCQPRSHLRINVILCMMRNLPNGSNGVLANLMTLFLAYEFRNNGVVAVDLAGAEARDATEKFEKLFTEAKGLQIPFTIHAGEAGDARWRVDSIERAIAFGAKRIGHGVGLENSKELRKIVRDNGIVVECCPYSNFHTKAVEGDIRNHPIRRFYEEGIKVTINTDNMTVSDTTLDKEYELVKKMGLTDADILQMQVNAVDGAFLSNTERKKIKKMIGAK